MAKSHILIVDDNEDIRNLIKSTLGMAMYDIGIAEDGEDALAYLEQNDLPDLIILDVAMPRMSGLEVLEIIKSNPQTEHITVIILSAHASQRDTEDAMNLGAYSVMKKPFGPLDLLALVDELFE